MRDANRDSPPNRDAARIYIVITMRSDFMGHCEAFTGLPERISECQFLAPRMDRRQLQEAIVEPLRVYSEMVPLTGSNEAGSAGRKSAVPSPAFVNRVLNDVGADPDMLPLMQHALKRTWQQAVLRCGGDAQIELTIADYELEKVGGFDNALNRHATEIYDRLGGVNEEPAASHSDPGKLTPGEGNESRLQRVCRRLFCCLSERREDGPLVRRPRTIDEIVAEIAPEGNADTVRSEVLQVAAAFSVHNLLVYSPKPAGDGSPTGDTRLDISHESLLRQWEKLSARSDRATGWLDIEYEDATRYRQLVGFTRRGIPLTGEPWKLFDSWYRERQPTRAWCERYAPGHYDQVEAFREKCLRAEEARLANENAECLERERLDREAQEQKDRRLKEQARQVSRLTWLAILACAAFAVAVVFWFHARQAKNNAIMRIQRKSSSPGFRLRRPETCFHSSSPPSTSPPRSASKGETTACSKASSTNRQYRLWASLRRVPKLVSHCSDSQEGGCSIPA